MKKADLQNRERIFKFRFWDKEKKKMLYPPFKGLKGICLIPTSSSWSATRYWDVENKIGFDCSAFDWADGGIFTGNLIIMQYTGLKDNKGKEIYEGDVLFLSSVFERHLQLVVEYNTELAQYVLYSISSRAPSGGVWEKGCVGLGLAGACQVIGHKYQKKFLNKFGKK